MSNLVGKLRAERDAYAAESETRRQLLLKTLRRENELQATIGRVRTLANDPFRHGYAPLGDRGEDVAIVLLADLRAALGEDVRA